MTPEQSNKQRVRDFFAALNRGDVPTLIEAYAPDARLVTMGRTLISGEYTRDQIAAAASGIFQAFPQGIEFSIDAMTAEGERVAVEARSHGLHVSGQLYSNHYHFLFEFRDGKVLRLKEYMDTEHATDVLCGGQRPPAAPREG